MAGPAAAATGTFTASYVGSDAAVAKDNGALCVTNPVDFLVRNGDFHAGSGCFFGLNGSVSSEQVSVFDRRYGGQVSAEWSFTGNQGIIITSGSFCGSDSEGVPAGAVDFNIDINGLGQASACPVPTTPVAGTVTVTFS